MEVSTRYKYNLRPRPQHTGSTPLPRPVCIVKPTFSPVLSINVAEQDADISEESEGSEEDWVYVLRAPINMRAPSGNNPVGVSPPTRQVLTPRTGETNSAVVPGLGGEETSFSASADDSDSDETLSGRAISSSSSEHEIFATARVNLDDFATASSVLHPIQDNPIQDNPHDIGFPSDNTDDIELVPSATTAYEDLIALTSSAACLPTGAGFGDPSTWDTIAHVILPRVTPLTGHHGHHTRSRGPTVDIPLPLHCPLSQRQQRGHGEDDVSGCDDDSNTGRTVSE